MCVCAVVWNSYNYSYAAMVCIETCLNLCLQKKYLYTEYCYLYYLDATYTRTMYATNML